MIFGSDHSIWDWTNEDDGYCPIDWSVSVAEFTFLKACDGTNDTPHYADEIAAARRAGKKVAPYVWCHGRNWYDPRRQAEFWFSRLKDEPLIAVDFENWSTSVPNYDDLYNAANRLRELGYVGKLLLYTSWGYWLSYGTPATLWTRLFDGGIWLSDPDDDPPVAPFWASASEKARKAPTPFEDVAVHQFSFTGDPAKYGITNGKNDVDENKSTPEKIAILFGGGIVVPPPPQGETNMKGTVITASLYVRDAPSGNAIGNLEMDDLVEADRKENGWWHLTMIRGVATVGENWAYEGATKNYIRTDAVVVPPTSGLPTVHIHQEFNAEGYPDLIIDEDWMPNA